MELPTPELTPVPTMAPVIFHLAFPVNSIPETKQYYGEKLGCPIGRESPQAVILNLYGHQIVAHLVREPLQPQRSIYPRHFGLVFTHYSDWQTLRNRAEQHNLCFYQAPRTRFPDTPLEHHTFFLEDPFFNLLEFKFYQYPAAIFGDADQGQVGDTHGDKQPQASGEG